MEEIKLYLKNESKWMREDETGVDFSEDILLIERGLRSIKYQAKEIEQLKEEKEALRLGYNEVMGETLQENTKLKEQVKEYQDLCSEAMGEQPKEWRDRFKQLLNK